MKILATRKIFTGEFKEAVEVFKRETLGGNFVLGQKEGNYYLSISSHSDVLHDIVADSLVSFGYELVGGGVFKMVKSAHSARIDQMAWGAYTLRFKFDYDKPEETSILDEIKKQINHQLSLLNN